MSKLAALTKLTAHAEGGSKPDAAQRARDGCSVPPGAVRPLPPALATDMGQRFDTDFSQVRVHEGPDAQSSADALGARAYTVGEHVVFGADAPSPTTQAGKRTLAHELAHVVQQRRGGQPPALSSTAPHEAAADRAASAAVSGGPVSVSGATGVGVARDAKPPATLLTPEDMLTIVLRQRGHTNRAPQAMPKAGPNAAAEAAAMRGKRLGDGRETHAFIQVVDKDGKVVAHEMGAHLLGKKNKDIEAAARRDVPRVPGEKGKVHAERMAVGALDRRLDNVDVKGGTMQVVVDQFPCPPDKKDCMGALHAYAKKKGLKLEVYVSARDDVTPKSAARTAFKGPENPNAGPTGSAKVQQIYPATGGNAKPGGTGTGSPAPGGSAGGKGSKSGTGSASGSGGKPAPASGGKPAASSSGKSSTPTSASAPAVPHATLGGQSPRSNLKTSSPTGPKLDAAKAISELESEARVSKNFTGRIQTYVSVVGNVLSAVDYLSTLVDAQTMLVHGTLLKDVQIQADRLLQDASSALSDAEERVDVLMFAALGAIERQASEAEDKQVLSEILESATAYARALDASIRELEDVALDLGGRADAIDKLAEYNLALAKTTVGPGGTLPQSGQAAMYISRKPLAGTLRAASRNFTEAARNVRVMRDTADALALMAHDDLWAINYARMANAARAAGEAEAARPKVTPPGKLPFASASMNQEGAAKSSNPARVSPGGGECRPVKPPKPNPLTSGPNFPERKADAAELTSQEEHFIREMMRRQR